MQSFTNCVPRIFCIHQNDGNLLFKFVMHQLSPPHSNQCNYTFLSTSSLPITSAHTHMLNNKSCVMFEMDQEVSTQNLIIKACLLSEIYLAACRFLAEIYSCGFPEAGTVLPDLQCLDLGNLAKVLCCRSTQKRASGSMRDFEQDTSPKSNVILVCVQSHAHIYKLDT